MHSIRYLLGPELIWLFIYGVLVVPARLQWTIAKRMDGFIETFWFWMPVLALLTFGLWWIPAVEKNWLLLRVWITCLVGGMWMFEKIMTAYGKTGPGVGMGYIVCAMFLIGALVAGTIVVKWKF